MEELSADQKTLVHLFLDHHSENSGTSGCAVIEFSFTNVINPDIDAIKFYNYYTAFLSIKARFKGKSKEGVSKWRTILHGYPLMSNPNTDFGAQSQHTLTEFRHPLRDLVALRFILQQPCSHWREFRLDDLHFFRRNVPVPTPVRLPSGFGLIRSTSSVDKSAIAGAKGGDPSSSTMYQKRLSEVNSRMKDLWALSVFQHSVGSSDISVGNYEKDGLYEGSLLVYN